MADRKCTYRRCQNGTVYGRRDQPPWTCMTCNGTGRIPSVADCQTSRIAGQRRYRLILVLRAAAQARGVEDEAAWARDALETAEPQRHAALLDSIERGRVEDVITALLTHAPQP